MVDDPVDRAVQRQDQRDEEPPVAMLHGFTQTRHCWGPIAEWLGRQRRIVTADVPGHGSAGNEAGLDCPSAARALVERIGTAHWLGYSLGGRIALHAALDSPDRVRSLVLIGATAGIEDRQERASRRRLDELRAEHLEDVGVSEFCREWLDMDMFASLPRWARFESERSSNRVEGLAGSLRNAGTGSMVPLWGALGALAMPVLCVAGEHDHRFVAAARRLAEGIGQNASVLVIEDAGHAVHLERPEATADVVAQFLDRSRA